MGTIQPMSEELKDGPAGTSHHAVASSPEFAGIVIYRRKGRSLQGSWTHQDLKGACGREVVHEVDAGQTTGNWPVDIYLPGETAIFFSGQLYITRLDQSLLLKWTGARISDGNPMSFTGIGFSLDQNTIVATFQAVTGGQARN